VIADATDGVGVLEALAHRGTAVEGADVTLLGAGGAATEIAFAMAAAGARKLTLWNRTPARAEELATRLQDVFHDLRLECSEDLPIHAATNVLISAVPRDSLGASELDGLGGSVVVVDLAYRPDRRPTDMVQAARARSLVCIDGREVLVRQGAASWRIWFETDAPVEVMARAVA
jgi:shikimate dehydrogenase